MSRTARGSKNIKLIVVSIVAVVALAGSGFGVWEAKNSAHVQTVTNTQQQTVQISYRGKTGTNALKLLEQNAQVTIKHYSFGDMVTSINGTAGNGPKYWMFYVNGKLASVGAGSYVTKDSDTLTWKLQ